jgi:ubiquinone/menaquinone biosynthesis C-methylase UbiE
MQFDDGDAYERSMGRWSRAVAPLFLRWLEPPARRRWLDVGCGNAILTEAVLDLVEPTSVIGIDASAAQVAAALASRAARRARFQKADAMELPFADRSFDCTVSGLVVNFVPDPSRALAEMRRVTVVGGCVGGYVWHFEKDLSPSGPLRQAMRQIGVEVPDIPGKVHTSPQALESLFLEAGFSMVRNSVFDVTLAYRDIDEFWRAQTPDYSPTSRVINAMTKGQRSALLRALQETVPPRQNGAIEYTARANAIKAVVVA